MNSLKKGFFVWILVSALIISCCYANPMPQKRRMVLRLPFVHNQENQNSFQQRTFLRMLNGSKIKKALNTDEDVGLVSSDASIDGDDNQQHLFMFRRIY